MTGGEFMSENHEITETVSYNSEDIKKENIKEVLKHVEKSLNERGYNAINQMQAT
jgi:uncharacterized protein (UPF0297 family)